MERNNPCKIWVYSSIETLRDTSQFCSNHVHQPIFTDRQEDFYSRTLHPDSCLRLLGQHTLFPLFQDSLEWWKAELLRLLVLKEARNISEYLICGYFTELSKEIAR